MLLPDSPKHTHTRKRYGNYKAALEEGHPLYTHCHYLQLYSTSPHSESDLKGTDSTVAVISVYTSNSEYSLAVKAATQPPPCTGDW